MQTVAQFVATHGLTMDCVPTDRNPHVDGESARMDHWKVTIRNPNTRRSLTVTFSQGEAWKGNPPEIGEVLDCLAMDASGFENASSFEDWCAEYGYDEDSRKGERTYNAIGKQARQMRQMLGDAAYETLLWKCERL